MDQFEAFSHKMHSKTFDEEWLKRNPNPIKFLLLKQYKKSK